MKKLLFSLGALTTVVAPVAVAVSCGSSKHDSAQTFKTSGELNKYITTNWSSLGNKADEVFNKLKDSDSHVVVEGLTNDKTKKGSTFKAVFIKGTPEAMPNGAAWDQKTGDDTFYKWGGNTYKDVDLTEKKSSAERWGMEENKLANFGYIMFLTEFNNKHVLYINRVFKNDKNEFGEAMNPKNSITIED